MMLHSGATQKEAPHGKRRFCTAMVQLFVQRWCKQQFSAGRRGVTVASVYAAKGQYSCGRREINYPYLVV
jgi:hypothetical protein